MKDEKRVAKRIGYGPLGRVIQEVLSRLPRVTVEDQLRSMRHTVQRNLPDVYRSIDQVDQTYRRAIQMSEKDHRWPVMLCSHPGTGKTLAALAWLDSVQDRQVKKYGMVKRPCLYRRVFDLVLDLELAAKGMLTVPSTGVARSVNALWSEWEYAAAVVLDELGAETEAPGVYNFESKEAGVVFEAIDRRVRAKKPIVLVTNWSISEFERYGRYESPTLDRIKGGRIVNGFALKSRRTHQCGK